MKPLFHRGKLIIAIMALASGLASVAATPVAQAVTHPAAAVSAPTRPGPQCEPPDNPC